MNNKFASGSSPIIISDNLIQIAEETPRGVLLSVVKPQPVCKLVFASMAKKWVYPEENTWKEWGDSNYKRPCNMSQRSLERVWVPPFRVGQKLFIREPWAFRECCDCYACDTPQATYHGKKGCFIYPTSQNQAYVNFQPAYKMPLAAARTFLRIVSIRMMRIQEVPVEQFRRERFVCPDGSPFPKDIRSLWEGSLSADEYSLYGWDENPYVWVIFFEK